VSFVPCMERVMDGSELRAITLGHPLVDAYLEFVGARGAVNTWLATAFDLKVFAYFVGHERLLSSEQSGRSGPHHHPSSTRPTPAANKRPRAPAPGLS